MANGVYEHKKKIKSERGAILRLNKSSVDYSLFNFLYVHWTSCFLQNNLDDKKTLTKQKDSQQLTAQNLLKNHNKT